MNEQVRILKCLERLDAKKKKNKKNRFFQQWQIRPRVNHMIRLCIILSKMTSLYNSNNHLASDEKWAYSTNLLPHFSQHLKKTQLTQNGFNVFLELFAAFAYPAVGGWRQSGKENSSFIKCEIARPAQHPSTVSNTDKYKWQ